MDTTLFLSYYFKRQKLDPKPVKKKKKQKTTTTTKKNENVTMEEIDKNKRQKKTKVEMSTKKEKKKETQNNKVNKQLIEGRAINESNFVKQCMYKLGSSGKIKNSSLA